jgi:hypothetical protein
MKITTKDHKNYVNLYDIDSGEVFRPVNSQRVFMKLWNEMNELLWNECESHLYDYYENPQEQELNDICDEGRACVDMATGEIIIFHRDLRVVKLKYAMEVEG